MILTCTIRCCKQERQTETAAAQIDTRGPPTVQVSSVLAAAAGGGPPQTAPAPCAPGPVQPPAARRQKLRHTPPAPQGSPCTTPPPAGRALPPRSRLHARPAALPAREAAGGRVASEARIGSGTPANQPWQQSHQLRQRHAGQRSPATNRRDMENASCRASTCTAGLEGAAAAASSWAATPGRLRCAAAIAWRSGARAALPAPARPAGSAASRAAARRAEHWRRKVAAAWGVLLSTLSTSSDSTEVVPSQMGSTCALQRGGAAAGWVLGEGRIAKGECRCMRRAVPSAPRRLHAIPPGSGCGSNASSGAASCAYQLCRPPARLAG